MKDQTGKSEALVRASTTGFVARSMRWALGMPAWTVFFVAAAALVAASLPAAAAPADPAKGYPSRPIRVIVPFGTGSITDILTRTILPKVSEALGQPIVIDNRPGAGGNIGTEMVVTAAPDGHTLVSGSASVLAVNGFLFRNMPYDVATAFSPITQYNTVTNVLVVTPALPVKSVKELIAYGKANPGKLSFASAGAGGTIHLAGEMFKAMAGIQMEHIVYKSSPFAHVDLFAGQVHVMFDGLPPALPHIRAGKLRALAVATGKRSQLLPELPTVAEAGLPGYNVQGWNGLAGPAGMPKAVVEKLNRETVRVLNMSDVRERLLALGAEPVGNTPEQFAAHMKAERELWGKFIKQIGLRLD
jgi:tripartite-type tricarboxylate transporter receptor subunit TctC